MAKTTLEALVADIANVNGLTKVRQLTTTLPNNYEQLKAKRASMMARHNNLTRELLALDVQINQVSPSNRNATKPKKREFR